MNTVKNKTTDAKWSHLCYAPCCQTKTHLQFQCSRNRILNQFNLISTSEVIYLIDPLSIEKLLKEGNLAITIPFFFFFFALYDFLLSASSGCRSLNLYSSMKLLSICQTGFYWIQIKLCSNKLCKFLICLSFSFNNIFNSTVKLNISE